MKKSDSLKLRRGMIAGQTIDSIKKEQSRLLRNEMTKAEKVLWQRIRAKRLDGIHFRRQQIIDGFIADFYSHKHGLVIEVDGNVHDEQKVYDNMRDGIFEDRGLTVLRFKNENVLFEIEAVLNEILHVCDSGTGE